MRRGNPTHKKSLSLVAVHELLPAAPLFDQQQSVHGSAMTLAIGHKQAMDTSRRTSTVRKPNYVVGNITGETSKHFLVKSAAAWIPVLKSSFFSSDGERLHNLHLPEIKNMRVKLFHTATQLPEAQFFAEGEEVRGDMDVLTDRIPDFETDAGFSVEDGTKALETHAALNAELLTDVVAMAALGPDPKRSQQYFKSRAPRLRKSIDEAMATLKDTDSELYAAVSPRCAQLLHNVDMLTREASTVCSRCRKVRARVTLSCDHLLCLDCAKELVTFSATDFKMQHCPLCQKELTLTDMRLILLEKYEALKKGMKYVHAIGIDLSQHSPFP